MRWPGARVAGSSLLLLFALSLLTFAMVHLAPGDAARAVAGKRIGTAATPEQVAFIRAELGLDRPLPAQYLDFAGGALTGDLGSSFRTGESVTAQLADRIPVTLGLAAGAGSFGLVVGVLTGLTGATTRSRAVRSGLRAGALLGTSAPPFWVSYLFVLVLGLQLGLLPTTGMAGPRTWVMPMLVLGLPVAAVLSRIVAVAVGEALAAPHVQAALARGTAPRRVLIRDALPNAAGPVLAVTGLLVGSLLASTLIVEEVFGWPGMGQYFVTAVESRDLPALQGCVLYFGVVVLVANALADAAHTLIDPRLRSRA